MPFPPWLVSAARDTDVLELGDVGEEGVPNHGPGMRVVVAVEHQHRRFDRIERLRLEARRLTSQDILPRLVVAGGVATVTTWSVTGSTSNDLRFGVRTFL